MRGSEAGRIVRAGVVQEEEEEGLSWVRSGRSGWFQGFGVMAAVASTASSYSGVEDGVPEQFPAGLRVLVVDDDMACLRILEQMLLKCFYRVTICCRATKALSLLREKRGGFDVVISDVHMPDMDGFKLLELVGLEMDLPVIMMSADGRTSAVMRGIKHGACDYLIKPVRIEELKNIWQHVIRKKWNGNKELEQSGSLEDSDHHRRAEEDGEYASSVIDGSDTSWKSQKKKRDAKEEEDGELENEDPSTAKKPRVVWSVELHQQFVSAVNQLGIDKAVPKRILELMNVPGLTRENVASHLQKFRLYLKRLSGVAQHQTGLPNPFCGSVETNAKAGSLGRLDFQALAASGQIPPQTLAALHAELLGRPPNCLGLSPIDQPVLLQASTQSPKCDPFEPGVAYGEPLMKCNSNMHKQFPHSSISLEGVPSGFSSWSSNYPDAASSTNNFAGANNVQNGNVLVQMLSQQHFPVPSESRHAINVQPSCLVAPSQSSSGLQIGNSPVPINQNHMAVASQPSTNFQIGHSHATISQNCDSNNSSKAVDCGLLSSQSSNILFDMGQVSDQDFKNVPMLKGYLIPGSISASVSSFLGSTDSSTVSHVHNPAMFIDSATRMPSLFPSFSTQGSGTKTETLPSQGQGRNHGFVGKGTCIPRRFAVDDIESPTSEMSDVKASIINDIDRVKQEFLLDFKDGPKAGNTVLSHGNITGPLPK